MPARPTPHVFTDQNGNEWWSVDEAAKRWGVARRRIYKWISGRANESKGTYTRKTDGARVQRKGYTERRRLLPGSGYGKINWEGREVIVIRAADYPQPIMDPMVRPDGIGQGEHHSTISYESNVEGGYGHPEQPFEDPFGVPSAYAPTQTPTRERQKPAAKSAPTEIETRAAAVVVSEGYSDSDIFTYARQIIDMFRARFAARTKVDPSTVSDADLRYAAKRLADEERRRAKADGLPEDELQSITAEEKLHEVFSQLFQTVYRSPAFPWTTDAETVERVRGAFIESFRQLGPLDGL